MTSVEQFVQLPDPNAFRLTNIEVPPVVDEQLALFTPEALQIQDGIPFDPSTVLSQLLSFEGKHLIAIDIGGHKIAIREGYFVQGRFTIDGGSVLNVDEPIQGDGENYLTVLEHLAKVTRGRELPVSISTAGLVEKTSLRWSPNATGTVEQLNRRYQGDFANLFGEGMVAVMNDAIAALKRGAVTFKQMDKNIQNVILIIFSSGLGGAELWNNSIFPQEPGHVRAVDSLNPFQVQTPCKVHPEFVCLENISASGALEKTYPVIHGDQRTGEELSEIYQNGLGNSVARWLYERSAFVYAHAVLGMSLRHGLLSRSEEGKTAIAFHGGATRVPDFAERVMQIVDHHIGFTPQFLKTHEACPETGNACLDGAAIGAIQLIS